MQQVFKAQCKVNRPLLLPWLSVVATFPPVKPSLVFWLPQAQRRLLFFFLLFVIYARDPFEWQSSGHQELLLYKLPRLVKINVRICDSWNMEPETMSYILRWYCMSSFLSISRLASLFLSTCTSADADFSFSATNSASNADMWFRMSSYPKRKMSWICVCKYKYTPRPK